MRIPEDLQEDALSLNSNLNRFGHRLQIEFIPRTPTLLVNITNGELGEIKGGITMRKLIHSSSVLQEAATVNPLEDWIQNPEDTEIHVMLYERSVVLHWITKTLMHRLLGEHNEVMEAIRWKMVELKDQRRLFAIMEGKVGIMGKRMEVQRNMGSSSARGRKDSPIIIDDNPS